MIKRVLHSSALSTLFAAVLLSFASNSVIAQTSMQTPGTVNCNRAEACDFVLTTEHTMPVTFSLSVTSEAKATPDMAMISFGVVTQGKSAADALGANNKRMNDVLTSMKALGIEAKSIQTSNLNVTPQYVYVESQAPKITGYQVTDQVTVRIENLSNLGIVIDSVTKVGVNQIDSISFDLTNDDFLLDQARKDAVTLLIKRAQLYAMTLGYASAELMSLSEGNASVIQPIEQPMFLAKSTDRATTPISSGEIGRAITLNAVFELKK